MQKCKSIISLIFFLAIQIVLAINCEDRLDNESSCLMITPPLSCETYDILNINNNTIVQDDQALTALNDNTGAYYFNFTEKAGDYLIILCDNSTKEFRVTETYDEKFNKEVDARMFIASIIGILGIIALFAFLTHHFHKKGTIKQTEGELSDSKDLIKDANWFKAMELFCILFILFLTVLLNNTVRLFVSESGASASILSMFNSLHTGLIAATILFLTLIMLRFLVLLVENFKRKKLIKEMGGEQDD